MLFMHLGWQKPGMSSRARVRDFITWKWKVYFGWPAISRPHSIYSVQLQNLDGPLVLSWAACYTAATACCREYFVLFKQLKSVNVASNFFLSNEALDLTNYRFDKVSWFWYSHFFEHHDNVSKVWSMDPFQHHMIPEILNCSGQHLFIPFRWGLDLWDARDNGLIPSMPSHVVAMPLVLSIGLGGL